MINPHLQTRQSPPRISKARAHRAIHTMVTTYYLSSPPRHPRTTKVTLRLPARAWNAYLPLPSAHSPSSPKRCNYRPGNGSFRYGARAITYVQPCLQPSCANCRRWYPRLIDEALPWHPEQKRASITRIAALLDGTSNSDNEMEECTDREEELDVDSTVGKYEPAIPRVVIARSSVRAGIYDTGIPAQYTVRLRYRSVGSKLHYEKVLLEQRRRCEVSRHH
ncbi:hypothetical protein K458DRAFT_418565 [Lentithecium fluviatile CBS 122367]|uniref:Uncharacterized protein n=1 Tax=Lentithecium fluviatile CBS 122367 TaxID=1168545 RepID=A0A6G1J055_9PLEO|nr:hypothetical protein K458DRAFT_418565 [Lentithecium fluviatile CBS 122367]